MIFKTIILSFVSSLTFGGIGMTNPDTGEEISLYNQSWAVVIGINQYEYVKPLDYCVEDANSIQSLLLEQFDFQPDNILFLIDQEATLQGIRNDMGAYGGPGGDW